MAKFIKYGIAAIIFLAIGLHAGSRQAANTISQYESLNIKVSQLQGEVLVKHTWEENWKKMTPEEHIYKGDAFLALHRATLELSLDKNNTVSLGKNSCLNLVEHNGQTEFGIEYGTVKATLDGPHEPFFISTPQGRLEALGTEFTVSVD